MALVPELKQLGDGIEVLLQPRLFGFPQMVTAGEQSRWLIPLLREARLVGAQCPKCGQVYAPAFVAKCTNPKCIYAALELIDLPDVGMAAYAEPVITYFAPARMHGKAPFGFGFFYLQDDQTQATSAIALAIRTTTGIIRQGIYGGDTPIKVVFKRTREGLITDVFVVPQAELSATQIAQSPLFDDELDWSRAITVPTFEPVPEYAEAMPSVLEAMTRFIDLANQSPRNQARLAEAPEFTANVRTAGGDFCLFFRDKKVGMSHDLVEQPSTTFAVRDPRVFLGWTQGKSLTDQMALGNLLFPAQLDYEAEQVEPRYLEDLDRLWRNEKRDSART